MHHSKLWYLTPFSIVGVVLFPTCVVLSSFIFVEFNQTQEIWQFLWETSLFELVSNTTILLCGVSLITFFLGTSLAWFVVMYQFPGRKFLEAALLLPMAMPGYVIGLVIIDHWDFAGIVPETLRSIFGPNIWLPEIRSTWAVILTMSLVLYPYVFIAARTAFKYQNQTFLDIGKVLGLSQFKIYWQIALPLARPTLFAGMALVIMEILADMGTVSIFSFNTFTIAIYETWQGLFQKEAAMQLAGSLMVFTFFLFFLGTFTQNKIKHHQVCGSRRPLIIKHIRGIKGWLIALYPMTVVTIAFFYSLMALLSWQFKRTLSDGELFAILSLAFNSVLIAVLSAISVIFLAICVSYSKRVTNSKTMHYLTQFSVTGFVLPGTIIALGVLIPFVWLDTRINLFTEHYFNYTAGLVLTGSIVGLVLAHTMRFFAIGFFFTDSGLSKISMSLDKAALSLGKKYPSIFKKIHLPLTKNSILVGALIVFIDVTKEMAATLILRPFGFNTLSTKIWELSAESYFQDASLCSLTIICVMAIPVFCLMHLTSKDN